MTRIIFWQISATFSKRIHDALTHPISYRSSEFQFEIIDTDIAMQLTTGK